MVEDLDDAHGVGAPKGVSRRLEACQSPVWDTALAMIALSDAGVSGEDPALVRARPVAPRRGGHGPRRLGRQAPGPGAGRLGLRVRERQLPRRRRHRRGRAGARAAADRAGLDGLASAEGRALTWTVGMQSSGGGWGAFDADNTRALVRELPFLDFGEVIDEPSADVTAHAVEMLAVLGRGAEPAARGRCPLAARAPGVRRLVVSAAGASTTSTERARWCRP